MHFRVKNGYRQVWVGGEWKWYHRWIEEQKSGPIPDGFHVHHIDADKHNNSPRNLIPLTPEIHDRLHNEDPDVCFRCGRSGHWAADCYAETDFTGQPTFHPYDGDVDGDDDDDEY